MKHRFPSQLLVTCRSIEVVPPLLPIINRPVDTKQQYLQRLLHECTAVEVSKQAHLDCGRSETPRWHLNDILMEAALNGVEQEFQ